MTSVLLLSGNRLDQGGVEAHLRSLVTGSDPGACNWRVASRCSPEFIASLPAGRVETDTLPMGFPYDRSAIAQIQALVRAYRIDVLHAHDLRSCLCGGMAARRERVPLLRTVHMPEFYTSPGIDLRSRMRRVYYRWLERLAHRYLVSQVIFVSSRVSEEAFKLGLAPQGRSRVIENGIDLSVYRTDFDRPRGRQALGMDAETTILCFVGRLEEQKGVDILLSALAHLPKSNWEAWLVGDGSQRLGLRAQASALGLGTAVRFVGSRGDVPDILRSADVFILPSRYEGMPMTLLEAMAAGLACVVADVGESGRLVRKAGCGLVVPPEDSPALSSAIGQLLSVAAARRDFGRQALRAAERFDAKHMVEETLAVYESLVGHGP